MALGPNATATLKAKPILYAVLACFVLETGMNAIFGYRQAGGGFVALIYAAVFIALAFLAAWTCVELFAVRGNDAFAWARRFAYGVPFAACFVVSQASGWGVLGVTMADGGVKRTTQATSHDVVVDKLAQLRAERMKIGTPRTIGKIKADLDLELRKTSKTYPNGDGPKATGLRGELAEAERALELDNTLIPAEMGKVQEAPQVATGSPHLAVLKAVFGGEDRDLTFWWSVGLVAVIGFFANFGFALAGVGHDASWRSRAHGKAEPDPLAEEWDWGPRGLAHHPRIAEARTAEETGRPLPSTMQHDEFRAGSQERARPLNEGAVGARVRRDAPSTSLAPTMHGAPVSPSQHMHAAPINIHFSGPPDAPLRALPAPDGQASALAATGPGRGLSTSHSARHSGAPDHSTADPYAPAAPDRPVRRGRVQQMLDELLVFHAACIDEDNGSFVPADEMWARYASHAGPRCISRIAFETIFPEATGIATAFFAGVLHFCDVRLRGEPELRLAETA